MTVTQSTRKIIHTSLMISKWDKLVFTTNKKSVLKWNLLYTNYCDTLPLKQIPRILHTNIFFTVYLAIHQARLQYLRLFERVPHLPTYDMISTLRYIAASTSHRMMVTDSTNYKSRFVPIWSSKFRRFFIDSINWLSWDENTSFKECRLFTVIE